MLTPEEALTSGLRKVSPVRRILQLDATYGKITRFVGDGCRHGLAKELEILLGGAISGAEHEFPRETEVVSLVVGQRSLDELERALVLASEEEQGSIGGDVVAVQR